MAKVIADGWKRRLDGSGSAVKDLYKSLAIEEESSGDGVLSILLSRGDKQGFDTRRHLLVCTADSVFTAIDNSVKHSLSIKLVFSAFCKEFGSICHTLAEEIACPLWPSADDFRDLNRSGSNLDGHASYASAQSMTNQTVARLFVYSSSARKGVEIVSE